MTSGSPVEYWNDLGAAADDGQLFLDSSAARLCDQACTTYLSKLVDLKKMATETLRVSGMGDLPSGIALSQNFNDKAAGGENNMADVLQGHIDVVMAMQAVFQRFFDAAETIDQDNASTIGSNGPK